MLDTAGCKKMTHREIVAVVGKQPGVGSWWQQMVTVGYEQARGLRVQNERPDGFSISRSKTIAASADDVFAAWNDKRKRAKWLKDAGFTIRKATPGKSLRITWIDGETNLQVLLYPKGERKCQLSVQHSRLKDEKTATKMKAYWGEQLDALAALFV